MGVKVGPGGASLPLAVAFGRLAFVYSPGAKNAEFCETASSDSPHIVMVSVRRYAGSRLCSGDVADVPARCGNQR